ncbi:rab3 GTPase-activating protein catalytic subunit [Teleopsis dalmanni]|uniref:rab3 GTPase-activating protein catalytic subunit n=1 Tax=Teleopsis dalmanni TaxID=139649 RepID=UPI0018CE923E|nr:rab3 GTPase-activating protein catalytic subunit [Teleopsis dalmanni]
MAEEIDEDRFYHEDFSTESDWEVFNAQLGELFQRWELSYEQSETEMQQNELFQCQWTTQSEKLEIDNKKITISYYSANVNREEIKDYASFNKKNAKPTYHNDLLSTRNTFDSALNEHMDECHTLARFYGLRSFVVICPHTQSSPYVFNMAEFNFLSSANVVAVESGALVPIFVHVYNPKWNYFIGTGISQTLRTNFNVIAIDKAPAEYCYLTGISKLFKEKLPKNFLQNISVAVRMTYALADVKILIPMHIPPFAHSTTKSDSEDLASNIKKLTTCNFIALPYGYFRSSETEQFIVCIWLNISDNIIIDSPYHSDFTESKAPKRIFYSKARATSYMSSCLNDYTNLSSVTQTLESIIGQNFFNNTDSNQTRKTFEYMKTSQSYTKKLPGPIHENELHQMVLYLFPEHLFPYSSAKNNKMRLKSAVPDSLVYRLSCLLATCNSHLGGVNGMAQLWVAFTRNLRNFWDNYLDIPGVGSGFPDHRTCLLHQKLQMLNICIKRRRERDFPNEMNKSTTEMEVVESDNDDNEDNENDEFYDCVNEDFDNGIKSETGKQSTKAEGRLKRLGNLKLLNKDEYLYIPVTQEPVIKTEDQLNNESELLLKLEHDSDTKTQIMCPSLLSDMEAFKAANPSAEMEDFIRWYSPRDWIDTTNESGEPVGELSTRMVTPGNTWLTVWNEAQAVPACKQKRLFDDTSEALKVLQFLESLQIRQILDLTIIPLLHSALLQLEDILNTSGVLQMFSEKTLLLLNDLELLSLETIREENESCIASCLKDILNKFNALEVDFFNYKCFEHKYSPNNDLEKIKEVFQIILKNGCCSAMNDIKLNDGSSKLIRKEYVLRTKGSNDSAESDEIGPQYLRAIVTGEKMRLCAAFTESTTFI